MPRPSSGSILTLEMELRDPDLVLGWDTCSVLLHLE